MIEIHCQLRCAGCGALKTTIIQMTLATAAHLSNGGLEFLPHERLRLLDIGDWRIVAGRLRCGRC